MTFSDLRGLEFASWPRWGEPPRPPSHALSSRVQSVPTTRVKLRIVACRNEQTFRAEPLQRHRRRSPNPLDSKSRARSPCSPRVRTTEHARRRSTECTRLPGRPTPRRASNARWDGSHCQSSCTAAGPYARVSTSLSLHLRNRAGRPRSKLRCHAEHLPSRRPLHRCQPRSGVTTFARLSPRMLAIRHTLDKPRSPSSCDRAAFAQYPIGWIHHRLRRLPVVVVGLTAKAHVHRRSKIENARLCRLRSGLPHDVAAVSRSSPILPYRRPEYLRIAAYAAMVSHRGAAHCRRDYLRDPERPLRSPPSFRARTRVNARAQRGNPAPPACCHTDDLPAPQGSSAAVSPPPSLAKLHMRRWSCAASNRLFENDLPTGTAPSPLIRASPRGVLAASHQRAIPVGLELVSRHRHRCRLRRFPVRSRPRRQREPETSSSAARSTEHPPRSADAASPTRNQRSRPGSALPAEPTRVANDPRRALDAPECHESLPALGSRRSGNRRCRR
jgi:hypothetical protein